MTAPRQDFLYVGDFGTPVTFTETAPAGVSGTVTWQAENLESGRPSIEVAATLVDGVFSVTIPDGLVSEGHVGRYRQSWQVESAGASATYPEPADRNWLTIVSDPTANGAGVVVPVDPTIDERLTALETSGVGGVDPTPRLEVVTSGGTRSDGETPAVFIGASTEFEEQGEANDFLIDPSNARGVFAKDATDFSPTIVAASQRNLINVAFSAGELEVGDIVRVKTTVTIDAQSPGAGFIWRWRFGDTTIMESASESYSTGGNPFHCRLEFELAVTGATSQTATAEILGTSANANGTFGDINTGKTLLGAGGAGTKDIALAQELDLTIEADADVGITVTRHAYTVDLLR